MGLILAGMGTLSHSLGPLPWGGLGGWDGPRKGKAGNGKAGEWEREGGERPGKASEANRRARILPIHKFRG